jgi:hypothetical protein
MKRVSPVAELKRGDCLYFQGNQSHNEADPARSRSQYCPIEKNFGTLEYFVISQNSRDI